MKAKDRKQMERASRILVFCREHPSDLTADTTAVSALQERLTRAERAVEGFKASALAGREAIAERVALRNRIVASLKLLSGLARSAGNEALGTPIAINFPGKKNNQVEFLAGARVAVATGREREELLIKFGLPVGHLDALNTDLEQFANYLALRNEASQARVMARHELGRLIQEMQVLVHQLDSIMRFRYRSDPASLMAWGTATDLKVGPRRKTAEGDGTTLPLTLPPGKAAA